MKIQVSVEKIKVVVQSDDNALIYDFRADNYQVELDVKQLIKSSGEIAAEIMKLIDNNQ